MSLEYATGMDTGIRKRQQGGINEDSIAVNIIDDAHLDTSRNTGVFVLADGAGGEEAGEIASYIASVEVTRRLTHRLWDVRQLEEVIEPNADEGQWMDKDIVQKPVENISTDWVLNAIEVAIQSTHTRIIQLIDELEIESAYTTIVACVKIGETLYYGWVGDSRAYVVNLHADRPETQRLSRLTRDHSVVEGLVENGAIDEIEAHVHRKGNQVTRALGGTRTEEPSMNPIQVETGHVPLFGDDIVLLTSDGLIDAYADAPKLHEQYLSADETDEIEAKILENAVTDDEIRDVVSTTESMHAAVDRFITLANERGGKDNLSLVLFKDPTLKPSPPEEFPDRDYSATRDSEEQRSSDSPSQRSEG